MSILPEGSDLPVRQNSQVHRKQEAENFSIENPVTEFMWVLQFHNISVFLMWLLSNHDFITNL